MPSDMDLLLCNGLSASDLLTLSDDVFRTIVDEDLRRRDEARVGWVIGDHLRSPEVVGRFFTDLERKHKSIDGQLASADADYDAAKSGLQARIELTRHAIRDETRKGNAEGVAKAEQRLANQTADLLNARAEFKRSKAKKLRFKTGVDMTLIEVRALVQAQRDSMYDSIVADERNHYAEENRRLRAAIEKHRAAVQPLEGDDIDEELWATVAPKGETP